MLKKKKRRKSLVFTSSINITPLMDVLTVLLFFLIKSMSVTSLDVKETEDLRLPASYIEVSAEEAVVVALSKKELLIGQEKLIPLVDNKFPKKEIGDDLRTLKSLNKVLKKKYENRMALYKDVEGADLSKVPAPKLLIQADKDLPFGLVKYVLHTVAGAGYTDYQFIIVPKN